MRRPALLLAAIIALSILSGQASAGKLDLAFAKPDPEMWELHGLTDADFTPDGLRFVWPASAEASAGKAAGEKREPKWIVSKKSYKDDIEVLANFDRSKAILGGPGNQGTQLMVFFDNPLAKRRAEMLLVESKWGDGVARSNGSLSYYKDGALVGRMNAVEKDPTGAIRLRKIDKRVFGAYQRKAGDLIGWMTADRPPVEFDEDCDEFRIGLMVIPPPAGEAGTVVLKSITLTGLQVGGRDISKEAKVLRFDFGPSNQEVAEGYIGVSPLTKYTPDRGYGWITDLKPTTGDDIKRMPSAEAVKHGLEPACGEEQWLYNAEEQQNWMMYTKIRPLMSVAHGWDKIEELGKTYDLKLPQEKDLVFAARPYGFPHNYRIEADQWERRGAIYVDDDLSTEFVVDVPNGRWNAILGVGFTVPGPFYHLSTPFSIDAQGVNVKKDLNQNWTKCDRFKIEDMEVKDGKLRLRFYGDRRLAMNAVEPADLGVGWLINYLVLCPAEDKEVLRQEEWRLITERGKRVRQLTFEPGAEARVSLDHGHMRLNGKPYLPVVLHYGYQWPRPLYGLYSWANTYTEALASTEIGGSQAFFQKDWERMSLADNYPWRAIASMNAAIRRGQLDFLYCESFVYIVPRAIQGEGGSLEDSRGRSNRWEVKPPLGSRLAQEILKESYTMVSNQLKLHPANPGYYIYEEFIHPYDYGYDYQSINQFRAWIEDQYKTIDALNKEWGRDFKSFAEVNPPKRDWDEGPEWRNFWKFRRWSMEQQTKEACTIVHDLEPEHTTMGQKCKPDPLSTIWHTAVDLDLFGGGGPAPAHEAAARYFDKALTMGGGYWDCPWSWSDGRRQLDHVPKEKHYLGKHLLTIYNDALSRLFQGTKGFWCEEYNDGVRHMFHRTGMIKRDSPLGKIKTWFGDIVMYDKEALDFAPVTPCLPPLLWSRAVESAYRLSPILIPAHPVRGAVAVLYTEDSYLIRTGAFGNHLWLDPTDRLLTRLRVPYDVVRPENIEALKDYPIVIVAGYTETVEPALVDALKAHLARGGKVLMFDHALGYDARTLHLPDGGPAFGFDKLAGFTYKYNSAERNAFNGPATIAGGTFLKAAKVGDIIPPSPNFAIATTLVPDAKTTVVAKVGDRPVACMNADGNVFALSLPQLRINWLGLGPESDTMANLIGDVLAAWGVKRPIDVKETTPYAEVRAMEGHGVWLAAVMNRAKDKTTLTATMGFLPPGNYDVVDVTGERPIIRLDDRKVMHCAADPDFRVSRFVAKSVSASELASKGLALEVDGQMARILLIRPADQPVWVDGPADVFATVASHADAVVVGDSASPAELAAAQKIVDAAKAGLGVALVVRKASEVKNDETRNEVRLSPDSGLVPKDGGFLVETFVNAPLKADGNLILVGSAATNGTIRRLAAQDAFTYDKVLEKVTPGYPGKGRGLVELVEGVTKPDWDGSSFCRDAIVVGGSDDAGTTAAAERLASLLKPDKTQ